MCQLLVLAAGLAATTTTRAAGVAAHDVAADAVVTAVEADNAP